MNRQKNVKRKWHNSQKIHAYYRDTRETPIPTAESPPKGGRKESSTVKNTQKRSNEGGANDAVDC